MPEPLSPTLVSLRLVNYRGFGDHTIPFRPSTVLVGRNNAGKSTIVEALRFVSLVTARYRTLPYVVAPRWSTFGRGHRGIAPSLSGLEFAWEGLFHQYDEPPAEVTASFSDGKRIAIQLGPRESIHAVLFGPGGVPIDRGSAAQVEFGRLATMPQVAPLKHQELRLAGDYVRSSLDSRLAPLHFRNQLVYLNEPWAAFRRLVASSWPGIVVDSLNRGRGLPGEPLTLFLRERDFVAEVGTMGHGLQMWLQTMWFFARTPRASMVVLDEPDVYMHADLQRRLVRMLKGRFAQFIVATHSAEIMSEVEPEDVLIIDRTAPRSDFADTLPAVQQVMSLLGTAHNMQLSRLWRARRFLVVEGDDLEVLAKLHATLFPRSRNPLRSIPHIAIGGWHGWQQMLGARHALRNAVDEKIATHCVLDRDYFPESVVAARQAEAAGRGIELHIWHMKELENYLLVPAAIRRVIAARAGRRVTLPTVAELAEKMDSLVAAQRDRVADSMAAALLDANRGSMSVQSANSQARERVSHAFESPERARAVVPGKELLGALSEWTQAEFGVGVSISRLASALTVTEIHAEIREWLEELEGDDPEELE